MLRRYLKCIYRISLQRLKNKINKKQGELVPLDEEDRNFLLAIFYRRRRFLFSAYAVLILMVLFASVPRAGRRHAYTSQSWREIDDSKYVSYGGMWAINLLVIGSIVMGPGIYILRRRVLAVKADVDSGVKEKVPYTILRKQHFPLTDQYFVWIDDPENLDHEISAETYYNCEEGDTLYIYRAAKSKLVFELNGRFELL